MKNLKPLVGVSQCLLGDAVRYDGQSKPNQTVLNQFKQLFELLPVCPEVEAGLSTPRPPVQLCGSIQTPELIGRDDPAVNITTIMQQYCSTKPAQLEHLSGFIFKSRSPSCGLNSTSVFIDDEYVSETERGIFARAVCNHLPGLPVIEESAFTDESIERFIDSVGHYRTQQHVK